jgi:hypothetical protein
VSCAIAAATATPNPSHVFDDFVVPDNVRNKRKYEIYDTTAGRAYIILFIMFASYKMMRMKRTQLSRYTTCSLLSTRDYILISSS